MNSFADKKQKPTTDEYLNVDLNKVLDRLNKNPNALQSEAEFISAVITVRNAKITENLNRQLVRLTCIVAIATVLLVAVPFITPSLESQRLEAKIANAQAENSALKREVQELKQALSVLNNKIQNISMRSSGAAQMRATP